MQPLAPSRSLRRDPAPSYAAYKAQRLWLTPGFRGAVRYGLPLLLALALIAALIGPQHRREALGAVFSDLRAQFENRPEFAVSLIRVEGAAPELADAVRAKLGLRLPVSSFDLDLTLAREQIENLDAVDKAQLRLRSGGVLQVVITQRVPALVWRSDAGLALVDGGGHRVAGLGARLDRADLPLIAGPGAALAAAEALEIFDAAGPVFSRLRGLVRVGERRWNMVLDRDQTILLPQLAPVAALERLLALDAAEDILARDLAAIDLRYDARPTLRLGAQALAVRNGAAPDPLADPTSAPSSDPGPSSDPVTTESDL